MPETRAPVALFIFNRPEETSRVFAAIRAAQPAQFFIIADGPRNESDKSLCEATRAIIKVDWPCEIKTNYSEKNLGAGERMWSGISWVFEGVERAIILEDDCLPDQTFFPFCEELLEKYEKNQQVMAIAGTSYQEGNRRFHTQYSYYFSLIPEAWGWATWRRAWKLYDADMREWPKLRDSGALISRFNNPGGYERFARVWDQYYEKKIRDSWDGQWVFACISHGGVCINTSMNLISNIGINERATHRKEHLFANLPTHPIPFPLQHPPTFEINQAADAFVFRYLFGVDKYLRYRLVRPIKNKFPNLYQKIKSLFKKV